LYSQELITTMSASRLSPSLSRIPMEKKLTILDIARLSGVGKSTVSGCSIRIPRSMPRPGPGSNR
jgi:hypothetical protein